MDSGREGHSRKVSQRSRSPAVGRSFSPVKSSKRSDSPVPYKGWPTGFVGHESSEPKTQSGWADTSKIYGEKSSTKLANGTRVSLPAMPHTLGRDWTPSPTSVLQQPFSPENSYNSSMSFFSRSPSPVHAQGGKAIVLRQAARQTRMASPLPGGYIASSLPSTAIVKSPMRSPIGWRSSSSDRPDQVQSPLGQEILDRVATSEDHQDDKKINDWVHQYKKENVSGPLAASVIARAWRRYLSRKFLREFMRIRVGLRKRVVLSCVRAWKQQTDAATYASKTLKAKIFFEWRDYCRDLHDLFTLIRNRLHQGDMFSQMTPVAYWRLGMEDMDDCLSSKGSVTAALVSCARRMVPMKWAHAVWNAWKRAVDSILEERARANKILRSMVSRLDWEKTRWLFRFWYRYTKVKVSERLGLDPPIPKPHLPEWDEWLWYHRRRRQLMVQAKQTYQHFRVRFCFYLLRWYASRNTRMRKAWRFAAQTKIQTMMQDAFQAFYDNARENRAIRHLTGKIMGRWKDLTDRNANLRHMIKHLLNITETIMKRKVLSVFQNYVRALKVLRAGTTLRLWQNRPLAMEVALRLRQEWIHLVFIQAWKAWRNYAISRISYVTFIGHHMVTKKYQAQQAVFYCWKSLATDQRTRKIICPTLVVKQNPPPWRRLLTEAETISIIPPNMRTPAKQLGNRMRTLVKVQYSKTPYAVIPNRQHRPPSKPLLEIWSLRESVMARYQASEPSEGINVWQRVVGLTIDRVGKRQPDWHRLVWEASGRTVNRLEALSQMERVRSLHEASLRGEQGASDGSDSDEDEHEHIFDRSNDHIMRQKMSKRQRIAASVDGFRNSKLGVKEHARKRGQTPEGRPESRECKRGFSFRSRSLARNTTLDISKGEGVPMEEISKYMSMSREDLREAFAYDLMVETEVQYFQENLARAESMMEGKVYLLLGAGPDMQAGVEEGLRQMYPWSAYEGETYYWFLRNMILHDEKCSRLELDRITTRNRVLTSWVTLHQLAAGLSRHRPEFTIQDPNIDLYATWEKALVYCDSSAYGSDEERAGAEMALVKAPRAATLDEVDAMATLFGCSRSIAIVVDRIAKFWWRRAKLRIDIRKIQLLTHQQLEQNLLEVLKQQQAAEAAEALAAEGAIEGTPDIVEEVTDASLMSEAPANEALEASAALDEQQGLPATDSEPPTPPPAAASEPSTTVGFQEEEPSTPTLESDPSAVDEVSDENEDEKAQKAAAVMGLLLEPTQDAPGGPQPVSPGGLIGNAVKGFGLSTSIAPSDEESSSEDEPEKSLNVVSEEASRERVADDWGSMDITEIVGKRPKKKNKRNLKKQWEREVASPVRLDAPLKPKRTIRRKGLRSLQKPSVLDGIDEPGDEEDGGPSSLHWQPTEHELKYLEISTPKLAKLLQDADREEQERHEASAEDLVDRFMEAVAEKSPRKRPEKEPKRGRQSMLEKLADRAMDLWIPRVEDVHDVLAEGIQPADVMGFDTSSMSPKLQEFFEHMVMQPLATRLIFWDRVQRANEMRQALADDLALERHMRDLCYGMRFEALPHGIQRPSPPKPHSQVLHGTRCSSSMGMLAPLMLPPEGNESSRWGAATLFHPQHKHPRRPATCEPPITGLGDGDDDRFPPRRRHPDEDPSVAFGTTPWESPRKPVFSVPAHEAELQEYVDQREVLAATVYDTLRYSEVKERNTESHFVADASISTYAHHLPPVRHRFAHAGNELAGWTAPSPWEPPTGRYTMEDYEGILQVPMFGHAGEGGRTASDAVGASTPQLHVRPERVIPICYNKEELEPAIENRKKVEVYEFRRWKKAYERRHEKIEAALRRAEEDRKEMDRKAVQKQIEIVDMRKRENARREAYETEIRLRVERAEQERREQLKRGVKVEYVGAKKPRQKTPPNKASRKAKEDKKPESPKSTGSGRRSKTPEPAPKAEVTPANFRRYLLQYRAEAAGAELDPDALLDRESSSREYDRDYSDDGGYSDTSDDDEVVRLDDRRPSNMTSVASHLGLSSRRLSRESSLASEDSSVPWATSSMSRLARMPSDVRGSSSRHSDNDSVAGSDAASARAGVVSESRVDKLITRMPSSDLGKVDGGGSLNASLPSIPGSPGGSAGSLHETMGVSLNAPMRSGSAARLPEAPPSKYAAVVPDINPFEFSSATPTG